MRNNPMLQNMIRNPEMRRMLFNPEMIRMQLQMQQAMDRGGGGGAAFPAPGVTDTTPQTNADGTATAATPSQPNATGTQAQAQDAAFANLFGGAGGAGGTGAANPFANLFAAGGANPFAPPQQNQNNPATGADANAQNTPFGGLGGGEDFAAMTRNLMQNPEALRMATQLLGVPLPGTNPSPGTPGSNPAAANPFATLFGPGAGFGNAGFGSPPPPADNRPPEEVYESQLRQLNEMGFFEFERNVSALRRSGGNVQGAIEYLLNGS